MINNIFTYIQAIFFLFSCLYYFRLLTIFYLFIYIPLALFIVSLLYEKKITFYRI